MDQHQFQVDSHTLCAPFNLICLSFFWLPGGRRRKVHPTAFSRWLTTCLDGEQEREKGGERQRGGGVGGGVSCSMFMTTRPNEG